MSIDDSIADTERVHDACLCFRAQRAARALARRFDAALRPAGLTNGQFSLLNALNRRTPASMADAARLLGLDRTTLTAALKPLIREGLVEMRVDEADRRGRRLSLTSSGRRRLASAVPLWRACHHALELEIGADAAARTRADLEALLPQTLTAPFCVDRE